MNVISMNIDELHIPERNMRIHTKKQIEEFKRSVTMFGQIRPIVVDENNVILCGNGLYETLKSMEYTTVDVYKITNLTENQKKKLMMADNKIFGLGIDDISVFDQFINELKDDLDIPGYEEDVLLSMIADAEEVTERISEYGMLEPSVAQAIQNNREIKEERMQQSVPPATNPQPDTQTPQTVNTPTTTEEPSSEPERPFVICPECGCKIWL